MKRFAPPALGLVLALGACKIERTPSRFLTQRAPATAEREEAVEELSTRLLFLAQSLSRGAVRSGVAALDPAPMAWVVLPDSAGRVLNPVELVGELERLAPADSLRATLSELRFTTSPRANVAWFAGEVRRSRASSGEPFGEPLRLTGVYARLGGKWQLVQAHLSAPVPDTTEPRRNRQ